MLKTLTFKNKTASIIWMLILALALVLVDYFLSPVATENGWLFKLAEKPEVSKLLLTQCREKIKIYQSKNNHLDYTSQGYIAQGCLNNNDIVFIKESNHKGEIFVKNTDKANRIAVNLQLPEIITINSKDEIFIHEQGRERVLKFWKE